MYKYIHLHANKKTINFTLFGAEQPCYQPLTGNRGSKSPGNFSLILPAIQPNLDALGIQLDIRLQHIAQSILRQRYAMLPR